MPNVPLLEDSYSELSDLRRFGLALAEDDRFVVDRSAAEALVERLFRQAAMGVVDFGTRSHSTEAGGGKGRVRAFGQFVRLYRRHIRRLICAEVEIVANETLERARGGPPARRLGFVAAVRMLPLELREALLIVALARFSHRDAALALDIPLSVLIDRLTMARDRLAILTEPPTQTRIVHASTRVVSHLRVVK